jgi:hypothetical protein
VNLSTVGLQDTVGAGSDALESIEDPAGSPFADELTGNGQPNTLTGWEGQDSLNGQGGDDHFAIRDGTHDLVTCGPGVDSVDADQKGVDSIFSDCENNTFAPLLPPPGNPSPSRSLVRDRRTPWRRSWISSRSARTVSLRRGEAQVARAIGARVSYRLSEAATVTFDVQRAAAGRRVGGRCVRPTSRNHRARPCPRWARVHGTFVHASLSGVNGLRFNGRVAGRRLSPGRYRLGAIARDIAGNRSPGAPAASRFRARAHRRPARHVNHRRSRISGNCADRRGAARAACAASRDQLVELCSQLVDEPSERQIRHGAARRPP